MENILIQHIDKLDTGQPTSGDALAQADDHIRFIKACIKATFPGLTFSSTNGQDNNVTSTASDLNKLTSLPTSKADLSALAGAADTATDPNSTGNVGAALTPAKVGILSDIAGKLSATSDGVETGRVTLVNGQANITGAGDYLQVNSKYTVDGVLTDFYTRMGVGAPSLSHFYTNAPGYYFNKGLRVDTGIISSWNQDLILQRAANTAHQMTLTTSGATFTGNVTAYSDSRLKEDVKTIENALDTVCKLEGVTYTRIENQNKELGFIAQQIEEACPALAERVVGTMDDERQTKHVNYANMVAVLVEAVKELKAEVDELKGGK